MPGLRVLICEDSRTYAAALRRMLEHGGDIEVVAVCKTAEQAIDSLPHARPDLVTMDIELPGMDGLAAVGEIMRSRPVPILVISSFVGQQTDTALAALAAGALDALSKADLDLSDPAGVVGAAFRRRVQMLGRAYVIRHPGARLEARRPGYGRGRRASLIGVCASTGGPQILAKLTQALPSDYAIPVLVVQHITAGFTEGLVRWLEREARLPVGIAVDGSEVAPGMWIAPEGAHLTVASGGWLSLDRKTVAGHHRPSGDVLFKSIAAVAGDTGVAVVLSGMGRDGATGAAEVRQAGGLTIAQDEASSPIYGMPRAAADLGVDLVLSPDAIAGRLLDLSHALLPAGHR